MISTQADHRSDRQEMYAPGLYPIPVWPPECIGAHDTGPMLFAGTAHQGVVCRRCKRFLPC